MSVNFASTRDEELDNELEMDNVRAGGPMPGGSNSAAVPRTSAHFQHVGEQAYNKPHLMSDEHPHAEHHEYKARRSQIADLEAVSSEPDDRIEQRVSLAEHAAPWPVAVTPLDSPKYRVADFAEKIEPILEEYFVSGDYDAFKHELLDLRSPSHHDTLVAVYFRKFLDLRKESQVATTREALFKLASEEIIDKVQLTRGIFRWVTAIDDLELDVPYAATNLGAFLEELCQAQLISPNVFARLPEYILEHHEELAASGEGDHTMGEVTEMDMGMFKMRRKSLFGQTPTGRASKIKDTLNELRLFKRVCANLMRRYYKDGCYAVGPVIHALQDLNLNSNYNHELVRRAILLSFDLKAKDRENVPSLLKQLAQADCIDETDVHHAISMILGKIGDLSLDCPQAHLYLKDMMAAFVREEILSADLVKQQEVLGYGGEAGQKILRGVLHATPEYSRMIWRGGNDQAELQVEIDETINEYFDSLDVQEVGRILGELHLSKKAEIDFLARLMFMSLEKEQINQGLNLIEYLHKIHWGEDEIMDAIEELRINSEDLAKDLPRISQLMDVFVHCAEQRKLIDKNFRHHRDSRSQIHATL